MDFTPFVWQCCHNVVSAEVCFRQRTFPILCVSHNHVQIVLVSQHSLWHRVVCPIQILPVFNEVRVHERNVSFLQYWHELCNPTRRSRVPKFHGSRMPDLFSFSKRTIYLRFAVHTCRNSFFWLWDRSCSLRLAEVMATFWMWMSELITTRMPDEGSNQANSEWTTHHAPFLNQKRWRMMDIVNLICNCKSHVQIRHGHTWLSVITFRHSHLQRPLSLTWNCSCSLSFWLGLWPYFRCQWASWSRPGCRSTSGSCRGGWRVKSSQ